MSSSLEKELAALLESAATTSGEAKQSSKEAGKMRLEGKEYVVLDGDIVHFRHAS